MWGGGGVHSRLQCALSRAWPYWLAIPRIFTKLPILCSFLQSELCHCQRQRCTLVHLCLHLLDVVLITVLGRWIMMYIRCRLVPPLSDCWVCLFDASELGTTGEFSLLGTTGNLGWQCCWQLWSVSCWHKVRGCCCSGHKVGATVVAVCKVLDTKDKDSAVAVCEVLDMTK